MYSQATFAGVFNMRKMSTKLHEINHHCVVASLIPSVDLHFQMDDSLSRGKFHWS